MGLDRRAWWQSIGLVAALTLMASCGGKGDQLITGPGQAGLPLAKLVGESTAMARTVVVVTLTKDGTAVEGATVAFSRSISGRAPGDSWQGTTDTDGEARIEIIVEALPYSKRGASGYYLATATDDASGEVIGEWGSIPINGGREVAIALVIGGRAEVTDQSVNVLSLVELHESFGAALNAHDTPGMMDHFLADAVWDYGPNPGPMTIAEMGGFFEGVYVGYPDLHVEEGLTLVSGNILVVEHDIIGSHLGEWMGIPASGGLDQRTPHIDVYECQGGKFTKLTTYLDAKNMLIRMGAFPPSSGRAPLPSFTLPDPEPQTLDAVAAQTAWNALWNAHDLENWSKMVASDADIFWAGSNSILPKSVLVGIQEGYVVAFPDLNGEISRIVDFGGGWILVESVISGTHTGPLFGIPATGQSFESKFGWLARWEGGLFTYFHVYFDDLGVLRSLGLVPG